MNHSMALTMDFLVSNHPVGRPSFWSWNHVSSRWRPKVSLTLPA